MLLGGCCCSTSCRPSVPVHACGPGGGSSAWAPWASRTPPIRCLIRPRRATREDCAWMKQDSIASGGQARVLVGQASDAARREELLGSFQAERARAFTALGKEASALVARAERRRGRAAGRRQLVQACRRLRERFEEAVRVDVFGTPERGRVADLLNRLEHARREPPAIPIGRTAVCKRADFQRKAWITRPRPGVDRMSSAWLIRRFVDPKATFLFGDPGKAPRAIPFDTFDAEFGHHEGR